MGACRRPRDRPQKHLSKSVPFCSLSVGVTVMVSLNCINGFGVSAGWDSGNLSVQIPDLTEEKRVSEGLSSIQGRIRARSIPLASAYWLESGVVKDDTKDKKHHLAKKCTTFRVWPLIPKYFLIYENLRKITKDPQILTLHLNYSPIHRSILQKHSEKIADLT